MPSVTPSGASASVGCAKDHARPQDHLPHIIACRSEHHMLDLIVLAIGLGFFALSVGYTIVCDRL
jgi:hypothetical protein